MLALFQEFFLGRGWGAKSIVMQICNVMLVFLLLSDKLLGESLREANCLGGGAPPATHPVEEIRDGILEIFC